MLTNDKWNREFEKTYREYTGTKHALTVTNGTTAIELALRLLSVEGEEVIMPTNTSAATLFAVRGAGAIPVLADIDDDLSLDPQSVEEHLTEKTGAVIMVHIGGFVSPNTFVIKALCEGMGIAFIEDGAQSVGAKINGKAAGSFGVMSTASFFSTKVITTGEGGMVAMNNDFLYEAGMLLRDQAKVREKVKGIYQNWHEGFGYNYRMTEVQALMGLTQMHRLEESIEKRAEIAKVYDEHLGDYKLFEQPKNSRPNWYKWIGKAKSVEQREAIMTHCKENGIYMGGMVYEFPLHIMPPFKQFARGALLNSILLQERMFCPPIHAKMTTEQAVLVSEKIKEVLK